MHNSQGIRNVQGTDIKVQTLCFVWLVRSSSQQGKMNFLETNQSVHTLYLKLKVK